jgi:hypothetical protein
MPPKKSLYLSEPKIQIDGQQASPELMKDLLQITIEESLHLPAMFTLVIHNSYIPTSDRPENKAWRHDQVFKIGKKVKLGFSSSTTLDNNFQEEVEEFLIEGEITAMEVHFNEKSEADIIVRGYDISHRLHRGRYNRYFLNETDSDIVKQIVKEVGIKLGNIEAMVGFEHGDIHRPYVIGGVWNGKDAPPERVSDSVTGGVRLRTIKTRVGHVLQFVEEDKGTSKTGIRVETKDGHKIYLNDSQRCIEIETKGGHKIKMDDMAKSVSVKSTGNMSLDAAGNIDISANGVITVKGAMIRLN